MEIWFTLVIWMLFSGVFVLAICAAAARPLPQQPGCSADFQSAVLPNSIRQAVGPLGDAGVFQDLRIGNPRYGRLETRATSNSAGQG